MSGIRRDIEEEFKEFNIPSHDENGVELKKNARKKLLAKAKKAAKQKASKAAQAAQSAQASEDWSKDSYGSIFINSSEKGTAEFVSIKNLHEQVDKEVRFRARIHTSRVTGKLVFLLLRQRYFTVQGVLQQSKSGASKQMFKFVSSITTESIVDVIGQVTESPEKITSTTQQDIEVQIKKVFVISSSASPLPIQLEDCQRPIVEVEKQIAATKEIEAEIEEAKSQLEKASTDEEKATLTKKVEELTDKKSSASKFVVVSRNERLNNRILDLRTLTNQAIFTVQGAVGKLFRGYLMENEFTEIHSPKLIGVASEGGANVFELTYFGRKAYLAQSPQLYKQMAISSDFNRVFEVAPVFRAENSMTHRHMTEFMGLDLEMAFNQHYHEVLSLIENLFVHIFEGINKFYKTELEVIRRQYPFEDLVYYLPGTKKVLRLEWPEFIQILRDDGNEIGDFDDVGTTDEKRLGVLIKQKYGVDFYTVDKFPLAIRPFYTMPDAKDDRYSNSYDIFIRGEEVLSGAQRIHDPELLLKRAAAHEIPADSIKDYVDAFRFGAWPHAGGGIGLERVVMLFLNVNNIRNTSLFPRTPNRLHP